MKPAVCVRAVCLVALAACGSPGGSTGDAGSNGGVDGGTDGGSVGPDAATGDGGGTGDAPTDGGTGLPVVPVRACGSATVEIAPALPTPLDLTSYGSYGSPPLFLDGDTARIVVGASSTWTVAAHGTAQTGGAPPVIAGAMDFHAGRSLSGRIVGVFQVGTEVRASVFEGGTFASSIPIPCTLPQPSYNCDVRAAGDGHLWVRADQTLHEQVGTTFENRGGAPIGAELFDVDAEGTVWVGGAGIGEVFQVWKLAEGAPGWTKTGALTTAMLGPAAAEIEGGFAIDPIVGAFAPDGSIHLWSSARCIGTGNRNKTQLYVRSQDGLTWTVEQLPDMTVLLDGHVTWSNAQVWANSFDNVRFVNVSSTAPIMQGLDWMYPSRQLNVIARCTKAGQPAFERVATAPLPGWTVRGFARLSGNGAISLLTSQGLTQIYVP
ncbi:MAG: hypothetical protein JWP01_1256 [Myxococcales bacterium]|nr:hypothetical protein [Myxococcales bacterium]